MQVKINRRACSLIISLLIMASCFVAVNNKSIPMITAEPSLSISLYKNNGYGMGNDINGQFTVNTEVSADVEYVEFYLDNQLQLNDTAAPFNWPFDTNNYTLGLHTISVVAYDAAGEQATAERQRNFVEFPLTFMIIIISAVAVTVIVSSIIAVVWLKKKEN